MSEAPNRKAESSEPPKAAPPPAEQVIARAVDAIEDRKGESLRVLDLSGVCDFADTFLIANGRSERQVQAIAEWVERSLRAIGVRPLAVEGLRTGTWVLLDYADIVIHIFLPATRGFYALERLWSDAEDITERFATPETDSATASSDDREEE